jgi:hypothetical protein
MAVCLGLAAMSAWNRHGGQPIPAAGWGDIAIIEPDTSDPSMWQLVPGVGPVLSRRLAVTAAAGAIRAPADLQKVDGVGPVLLARLQDCIRW